MPTKTDHPSPTLYRRYFTPAERRALDALPEPGITSEINLLRVVLARNFGTVLVPADLKSRLSALRARAHAASLIASLLRTQVFTLNSNGELERLIDEALKDMDPYLVDEPATDPSPSIFTSSNPPEDLP